MSGEGQLAGRQRDGSRVLGNLMITIRVITNIMKIIVVIITLLFTSIIGIIADILGSTQPPCLPVVPSGLQLPKVTTYSLQE